mmetsp:Transcript_61518/g.162860  ORF Transcript_61518/g.162860 Transcript_61518/m.162860 type:complete len:347 (-) Transcript_61518:42-1082(-)
MTHDLLSVHEDRYEYRYVTNNNAQVSKEVLLNETDPLWKRLRHMHIADLTTLLHSEYKKFLEANKQTANLNKKGEQDLKTMSEGIKGMPKFQEETARYSLHIHVTSELVRKYNEGSLERVATLEQSMATGEDATKKPHRTALPELKALLSAGTELPLPLSEGDKIRLLMIYVITQDGIKSEERRQLMQLAGIQPEDQLTILALVNLGVTMMQGTKKKPTKKSAGQADATYDVSRYVPPLKRIMEEAFTSGLPLAEFPFVRPPSASPDDVHVDTKRSKAAAAAGTVPASGRRLIVFVLGGATHSEMRAMYEVAKASGREIMMGATAILSPSDYLVGLKQLKKMEGLM